jgi:hypothetical protein
MKQYHERPDYKRNLAELNASRNMPANTPNTTAAAAQAAAPKQVHTQPTPNYGNKMQSDYGLPASNPDTSMISGGMANSGESQIAALLKQMLGGGMYQAGPDNPYMSGLESARSASLKALADAKGRANENFTQSNSAIGGIYEKGRRDTMDDNNVLQASNDNLVGGLDAMYDGSVKDMQDERSQVQNQRMEMAQRMGLTLGVDDGATAVQDDAIQDTMKLGTAAKDKALQYGGADIASNTARASGLIAEGSGRQAELRSQLSGILGELSNKELDINNQFANASMQATNQTYQDNLSRMQALYGMYDKEQSRASSQQNMLLKSPVIAKLLGGGGGSSANNMANINNGASYISQQGQDPAAYENAYTDAIMGVQAMPGQSPTDQQIMMEMIKRGGLDPNMVRNFVTIQNNPSKFSPQQSSGIDPSILAMLIGG